MKTIGDLCRVAPDGVLTTDRDGILGCGAIFWTNEKLAEMGLLNETITVVSESEDPEAWALMREAARELHGAQVHLQIVAVGSAPPNHLDVQVIYGALRSEGVS